MLGLYVLFTIHCAPSVGVTTMRHAVTVVNCRYAYLVYEAYVAGKMTNVSNHIVLFVVKQNTRRRIHTAKLVITKVFFMIYTTVYLERATAQCRCDDDEEWMAVASSCGQQAIPVLHVQKSYERSNISKRIRK